jgi:hypothetical protein
LLKRAGATAKSFGKDLESENGLTIEGIAVHGDTIWLGLRAPVDEKGVAFLVGGNVADLFKAGHAPSEAVPMLVQLPLEGLGIRDLALLPDNRLLVVAGAPHGKEVPFQLFVVDPAAGHVKPIGQLAAVTQTVKGEMKTGKAEGVTLLEATADKARIVILFDSLPSGAPHQADILIPK